MNERPDTLDAAWDLAWSRLLAGARHRGDPFHQGVLATISADGPQARYAVLRAVDAQSGSVAFHTDRRSPKCAQLEQDARVSWCFFGHGEQLRLQGQVSLHLDDAEADRAWAACRAQARMTYATPEAPGTPIPPAIGLRRTGPADAARLAEARGHFALAHLRVEQLDWLSLDAGGHLRASFVRRQARWDAQWLAP